MPTAAEHQRKAEHNLRFLETIDPDEFCDWVAVVAFYTAVHLVEKLRALVNQHSLDHGERLTFVREQHPQIHVPYRELYNVSLVVRYGGGQNLWLTSEYVLGCLTVIQDYVREAGGDQP